MPVEGDPIFSIMTSLKKVLCFDPVDSCRAAKMFLMMYDLERSISPYMMRYIPLTNKAQCFFVISNYYIFFAFSVLSSPTIAIKLELSSAHALPNVLSTAHQSSLRGAMETKRKTCYASMFIRGKASKIMMYFGDAR
jgi:hypothetical protein